MERQEKSTISEIKKNAKANQIDAVKIGAKDLVRTRGFIKKFIKMESQMNTVSMQLQMMKSTEAMNSAMKGVTKAMVRMNKQIKLPKVCFFFLSLIVFVSNLTHSLTPLTHTHTHTHTHVRSIDAKVNERVYESK